jgi:hypothetical protein
MSIGGQVLGIKGFGRTGNKNGEGSLIAEMTSNEGMREIARKPRSYRKSHRRSRSTVHTVALHGRAAIPDGKLKNQTK